MVVLSLSSRFNKAIASRMLRYGLSARFALGGGVIRDSPYLDSLLLLPLAKKIVSIEAQDDAARATEKSQKGNPSIIDKMVDTIWDRIFENSVHRAEESLSSKEATSGSYDEMPVNARLEALDAYLRPALIPHNKWSDVIRWHFNHRFVKWARMEFLIAKHGSAVRDALDTYPKLMVEPLKRRNRTRDSVLKIFRRRNGGNVLEEMRRKMRLPLPSSELLVKALGMQKRNRQKDPNAERQRMTEVAQSLGGNISAESIVPVADIPLDADLSKTSLEDLLEVIGGHVAHCGSFNVICEEGEIYEFWTKEYITALATYLLDRSESFKGETVILDVGAGDGALAYYLRESISLVALRREQQLITLSSGRRGQKMPLARLKKNKTRKKPLPTVVATDDGSWQIEAKADVELLNVVDSMKKFAKTEAENQQLIVICSWMPMGEDWTADIRSGGADEYILVGQCDDGNCGDNWTTWGNKDYWIDHSLEEVDDKHYQKSVPPAPYELDGFVRFNLTDMSKLQYSRFDSAVSRTSTTVSFRRQKSAQ